MADAEAADSGDRPVVELFVKVKFDYFVCVYVRFFSRPTTEISQVSVIKSPLLLCSGLLYSGSLDSVYGWN